MPLDRAPALRGVAWRRAKSVGWEQGSRNGNRLSKPFAPPEDLRKGSKIHRLNQVQVEARLLSTPPELGSLIPGDRDEVRPFACRLCSNALGNFEPVGVREPHVHDEDIQ
jgi:hypothetical protein